ncbi:hypothetical protein BHE90_008733 [Fusarium euwallaceae]|uniref:Uncharacterized protein n=1 Tax=Fusarium euwallaceae TaxID=1147111 RepID=A0A430LM44_9HYPO|nr:hypothetical protein BHE90_008733 [Fusarium euwallaceae]
MAQVDRLWAMYEELIDLSSKNHQTTSEDVIRLKNRLQEVAGVVKAKTKGSLRVDFSASTGSSPKVEANVFLEGEDNDTTPEARRLPHESLSLYRRKTYGNGIGQDCIFLDAESEPGYTGAIPGTVTAKGFGVECWEAEYLASRQIDEPRKAEKTKFKCVEEKKILRRIDEIRRGTRLHERSEDQRKADLEEFAVVAVKSKSETNQEPTPSPGSLCNVLNRTDVFTDFTTKSSISSEWASLKNADHGKWHLLWQIILARELALDLETPPESSNSELSRSVLAALIIQDQWLQNVEVVMEEMPLNLSGLRKLAATGEVKARAEDHKEQGDRAVEEKQWKIAKEFYTKAIELDLSSATYRAARPVADLQLGNWANAAQDALVATKLDPKNVHAWNMLAAAWKKGGNDVRALAAYEHAVKLAGPKATDQMKEDLAETKARVEELSSPQPEQDQVSRDKALKVLGDQQSVLGRVLGAWSGVTALCGWVGPCPPVVVDHPMSKKKSSACMMVDAKPVDLIKASSIASRDPDYHLARWRPRSDEDLWAYSDDMTNDKKWVTLPHPPIQDLRPVAVKAIRLKQIHPHIPANERNVEYRASIDFSFVIRKLVPLTKVVTYTLFTNPIFVSLPPCHGGKSGGHEVHAREIQKDQTVVIPVHQMKDFDGNNKDGRLIVINAACNGGEIMARAWCAEKGRNAVVRRGGGPCYACATRVASKGGFDFGVLIWVSHMDV